MSKLFGNQAGLPEGHQYPLSIVSLLPRGALKSKGWNFAKSLAMREKMRHKWFVDTGVSTSSDTSYMKFGFGIKGATFSALWSLTITFQPFYSFPIPQISSIQKAFIDRAIQLGRDEEIFISQSNVFFDGIANFK